MLSRRRKWELAGRQKPLGLRRPLGPEAKDLELLGPRGPASPDPIPLGV